MDFLGSMGGGVFLLPGIEVIILYDEHIVFRIVRAYFVRGIVFSVHVLLRQECDFSLVL